MPRSRATRRTLCKSSFLGRKCAVHGYSRFLTFAPFFVSISFFVFHGGSGSEKHEITTAVKHGVVKMNVDTDTQWAYLLGIRDYILNKKDYLMTQVGNPDGADKPNKKFFDPRVWVREGEKTMATRCKEAFADLQSAGKL